MGKILITGGAGYIGSHTNLLLREYGLDTLVLDNFVYGHPQAVPEGNYIEADLNDPASLDTVFSRHSISAVLHFAAYTYVGESVTDPEKYYRNNLAGSLNLLSAMRKHDVEQIVFSSTCAVYGPPQNLPLDENHPCQPINPYGHSKRMVEQLLADFATAYGLQYTILRYFNAAGADPRGRLGESHNPETHLIPLILQSLLDERARLKVFGTDYATTDGSCVRDYIHVQDLAEAHLAALEYLRSGGANTAFNLGNGNGYSVLEVIAAAEKVTGNPVHYMVEARREGDPDKLISCSDKAHRELGWQPRINQIEEIIRDAWHWEQNRKW